MKFEIEIPNLLENLSGIYKIENNINDMVYIGRAKNLRKRAERHKTNYKHKNCNSKLNKFIEEHPAAIFKFTVIEFTNFIKEEEERYIAEYEAVEKGFNIIHNDEEFLQKKWSNFRRRNKKRNKTKKVENVILTEKEAKLLKKGYIRKDKKLAYNPIEAKKILNVAKIKNIKRRKKGEWKPADLSWIPTH